MTLRTTNEHRAGNSETESQKLYMKLQGEEEIKSSTQLPASVPTKSAFPNQHVCLMKGERLSCLYSPQKKKKKISHDVTMNPS